MDIKKNIAAMVWDGMTPDERRCWAMMIDAYGGPLEYTKRLNDRYSPEFQDAVVQKWRELSCVTSQRSN